MDRLPMNCPQLKERKNTDFIIVDSAGKTTDEGIKKLCLVSDAVIVPTSLTQNDLLGNLSDCCRSCAGPGPESQTQNHHSAKPDSQCNESVHGSRNSEKSGCDNLTGHGTSEKSFRKFQYAGR